MTRPVETKAKDWAEAKAKGLRLPPHRLPEETSNRRPK